MGQDVLVVIEIRTESDAVSKRSSGAFEQPPEPATRKMIDDHNVTTWATNTTQFRNKSRWIRSHGKYVRYGDTVEGGVLEGQIFRIHDMEFDIAIWQLPCPSLSVLKHIRGQVDSGASRGLRIAGERESCANAHFENAGWSKASDRIGHLPPARAKYCAE